MIVLLFFVLGMFFVMTDEITKLVERVDVLEIRLDELENPEHVSD